MQPGAPHSAEQQSCPSCLFTGAAACLSIMSFLIKVWEDGLGGRAGVRGQVCLHGVMQRRGGLVCARSMSWRINSILTVWNLEVIRMSSEQ